MKILLLFPIFIAKNFFGPREELGSTSKLEELTTIKFMSKLANKDAIGSLPADQISNTLTAVIGLGSPPQALQVLFDTGSTLFWVRSSTCQTEECQNQRSFLATNSATHVLLKPFQEQQQSVTYGDGTQVTCTVQQDALVIGRLTIPDQRTCLATSIHTNTTSTDGIIGLGPPGGQVSAANVFATLMADTSVDGAVISFWFNLENTAPGRGQAGGITFGGVDSTKIVGPTQWLPLSKDRSFWNLGLDKITDGGGNSIVKIDGNIQVAIDTGTTLSLLPENMASAFNAKIGAVFNPAVNLFTIACNSNPAPVIFYLSGNSGPLSISGSRLYFRDGPTGLCISIIQSRSDPKSPVIFGATFIRNWVTVFDYGKGKCLEF